MRWNAQRLGNMCKFDQYLHTLRKNGTNTSAICVSLTNTNLTTYCTVCERILQCVWACVNFVHNLRCLLKKRRRKNYATAGRDKYDVWCRVAVQLALKAPCLELSWLLTMLPFQLKWALKYCVWIRTPPLSDNSVLFPDYLVLDSLGSDFLGICLLLQNLLEQLP